MKSIKEKEWCIALDNIGIYTDPVLCSRYKFLKGERATKEKVFNMIPDMTEEEYARCFRSATEEEINGEFDWDGKQYVLKRSESMKNIKEKSLELYPELRTDSENWDVIEEQCDRDDQRKAFAKGANYVLDHLSKTISVSEDGYLRDNLKKMIEWLEKK